MPDLGHFRVKSITRRELDADIELQAEPSADQPAGAPWDPAHTKGANAGTLHLRKIKKAAIASVTEGNVYLLSISTPA